MRTRIFLVCIMFVFASATASCGNKKPKVYADSLTDSERKSIVVSDLSSDHDFYKAAVSDDPECVDYITEFHIEDEEIGAEFVVHVSLPPDYSAEKSYPTVVMTDGIWRLTDHTSLRKMMNDGRIRDLILVSIGYPNGYDHMTIRERDLYKDPESFLHFIVDNLVPYLSERYTIDQSDMTLVGHSNGGYFALYVLFNNDTIGKDLFRNYLVASPALAARTDGKSMEDFENEYFARKQTLDAHVSVTVGEWEPIDFVDRIDAMVQKVESRDYPGLILTYEVLEKRTHTTSFKPALDQAILVFYGT
ncbi:MAG: enterochelin esterase [Clostridiales bacterium]|nr:enterochelin esterase [Clostridiales bacterium]